jgi:hypothetical protein
VLGYIFPALVAALVPIRSYMVYYMFTEEDLKYLDPFAETLTNLKGVGGNGNDKEEEKESLVNTNEGDVERTTTTTDETTKNNKGKKTEMLQQHSTVPISEIEDDDYDENVEEA